MPFRHPADCQSAIRLIKNLRYTFDIAEGIRHRREVRGTTPNMKTNAISTFALSASLLLVVFASVSHAGHRIESEAREMKTVAEPVRTWFPEDPKGQITLGGLFSEGATGTYLDTITGLWAPQERDALLFLNGRYHLEDNGQFISSAGLGFRQLLPGHEAILGGNVYWDSLHSSNGNDFAQLGVGAEVLTHWIDFRFNYYLPEEDRYEVDRHSTRERHTSLNAFPRLSAIETTRTRHFKRYEAALEGFNAEVGFLIPGLDRYLEVRAFGGYYHYDNPFGRDFEGFKARLEARVLQGVIADLEYWDDAALMGGHWTAGVRVSVPFSVYNLVTGRNPFEGAGDSFKRGPRAFQDRMSEMVMRSHRIQTTTSGDLFTGDSLSTEVTSLSTQPPPGGPGFPIE
jgi:Inverse autotransporter, beta-domain